MTWETRRVPGIVSGVMQHVRFGKTRREKKRHTEYGGEQRRQRLGRRDVGGYDFSWGDDSGFDVHDSLLGSDGAVIFIQ